MNSGPIKTGIRCVACGGAILGFVVLLTLVFSFLGTILCALLAGMMMGATRPSKWLSIPISLLFPAVIFTVLRLSKTDLADRQVVLVSLLCFGAFWLIYALAAAVIAFEQKGPPAPAQVPGGTAPAGTVVPPETAVAFAAPLSQPVASPSPAIAGLAGELSLEELQGKWLSETPDPGGHAGKKEIEIKESELVLRIVDAQGRRGVIARGEVRLESSRPTAKLVIAFAGNGSGAGPA